jgi:recombination protein RecR
VPDPISAAAAPVVRLIEAFHKLPGIGPKSAQRLTYHILRIPKEEADRLAEAITEAKEKVFFCSICQNITDTDPCQVCADPGRDHSTICVVAEPLDILSIERTSYRGLYHVLHGVISPMDGIGPEQIRVSQLLGRLKNGEVKELILATNPTLEGEATAMYLGKLAQPLGIRATRLARGLPVGGDLEYADDITLSRALEGRQEL